jgi:hypothetical protein
VAIVPHSASESLDRKVLVRIGERGEPQVEIAFSTCTRLGLAYFFPATPRYSTHRISAAGEGKTMNSNSEFRQIGARCCAFGGVFVLLGIVAFCGGRSVRTYIDRVAQWPSVTGKIVTSKVSTATVRTGRFVRSDPVADVQYTFSVDGKDYRGVHLRPLPMLHMKPEGTPDELVARYPAGRSVQVHYDPRDPSAAVLIPDVDNDVRKLVKASAVIGLCLALLGLMLAGIGAICWFGKPESTPGAVPPPVVAHKAPPKVKLGIVQRILRGTAIALGLPIVLLGGVLLIAAAGTPNPSGDESTRIVAMVICGGAALFGLGLVYAGLRRPRIKSLTAAA